MIEANPRDRNPSNFRIGKKSAMVGNFFRFAVSINYEFAWKAKTAI